MTTERTGIPVTLPPLGPQASAQEILERSRTHWFWTAGPDINNQGPLDLYSQIGFHEQRWHKLRRCTPYPLGNLTHQVTDREAVEAMGVSLSMTTAPMLDKVKYAADQAVELAQTHESQGGRILVPLTGMDDPELVFQIFQAVQPFEYTVAEMLEEFVDGGPAVNRVIASNLDNKLRDRAYAMIPILLRGAQSARRGLMESYDELIKLMANAQTGKTPSVGEPDDHHKWICNQLGKPVPRRIELAGERAQTNGADSTAVKILMDRDAARDEEMRQMRAEMDELRAQRTAANTPLTEVEPEPPSPTKKTK